MQAKIKLRVDAEAIGNEMARIAVIFHALEKTALSNTASTVRALEKSADPQVQTLIDYLDKNYSNLYETQ